MDFPSLTHSQKYYELNYEQLEEKTEEMYEKIEKDNFIPDTILAIARGGWFPARILSDIYSSKEIDVDIVSVTTKFYTTIGKTKSRPLLLQNLNQTLFDQRILIVDDVSDSGTTLGFIRGYAEFMGAKYTKLACVFYKPQTKAKPDYYVEKVPNDTWIIFPYEKRETKYEQNKLK